MSLCSLFLSLETPNDVRSVAQQSKNIQATSKSSDQTACMRRLTRGFADRTYHIVGNLMSWLILCLCEQRRPWRECALICAGLPEPSLLDKNAQASNQYIYLIHIHSFYMPFHATMLINLSGILHNHSNFDLNKL